MNTFIPSKAGQVPPVGGKVYFILYPYQNSIVGLDTKKATLQWLGWAQLGSNQRPSDYESDALTC